MTRKFNNKLLIERIKEVRKSQKLNQEQLAEKAGLSSNQVISQIENGTREIKANELFQIANALHVDISYLVATERKVEKVRVFWRNPPENVHDIEANLVNHCRRYYKLESLCEVSKGSLFPCVSIELSDLNYHNIHELAEDIGRQMDLGCRPALALEKVLEEKYGVRIFYTEIPEGSAASTSCEYGNAILINKLEVPWRRNFDFAHEIFHLVTWPVTIKILETADKELFDKVEKLANAFAAHLLMPSSLLSDELIKQTGDKPKISYFELIKLARTFDVSMSALIWQLYNLNNITEEKRDLLLNDVHLKNLDREISRGFRKESKGLPDRYVELAYSAYLKGKISRMKLSEYLECGLMDIDSVLGEYGIVESEDNETEITFIGRERCH